MIQAILSKLWVYPSDNVIPAPVSNATVPSLPTEMIQAIFSELCLDPDEHVATALAVSSVSRHWRAVALSTPSLWSTFSFSLRTDDFWMLDAFLDRSRPEPLNITISFDFSNADEIRSSKVQVTVKLFQTYARHIEHLRLRFFTPMHGQSDTLGQFLCFYSPLLKSLEIESLNEEESCRQQLLDDRTGVRMEVSVPESADHCYPALTHVTCTDVKLLNDFHLNMTYLCIKGVAGHPNIIKGYELVAVLSTAQAITQLVIDGVSLQNADRAVTAPHLRTLSVRRSELLPGSVEDDARELAAFLGALDAPALTSLTIYDLNEHLPVLLYEHDVCFPNVTRFAVVPGSSDSLFYYPDSLTGVEELVLLGSDPELLSINGLLSEDWPQLRTVDLSELNPPPKQCLPLFWKNLYWYGRSKFQSDSPSRMLVRLPPGILPQDSLRDVAQFMDLHTTYYRSHQYQPLHTISAVIDDFVPQMPGGYGEISQFNERSTDVTEATENAAVIDDFMPQMPGGYGEMSQLNERSTNATEAAENALVDASSQRR